MNARFVTVLCFVMLTCSVFSQKKYRFSGTITDSNNKILQGATVRLLPSGNGTVSDTKGLFFFDNVVEGTYRVEFAFLGYKTFVDTLTIESDIVYAAHLKEKLLSLHEVVISDHYTERRKREESLNMDIVNSEYMKQNLGGSLMKSLERLPGVTTIDIGSGQSKPVIRGLGFNRVAVVENGIKHEAQQWGSDHGLEIDQYAVENIEIIKGPASLLYGSDAIGGVIDMKSRHIPVENTFGGTVDVTGKSNNAFLGGSASLFFRKRALYGTLRVTVLDYGDYKVPTDYVDIYSYRAPLYENYLRNTAGRERDLHASFGYAGNQFQSRFNVSNVYSKSGFFANAHGLEPLNIDTELHDSSNRDIQQPYQSVNHFKVTNESKYLFGKSTLWLDLGFQRNFRQEKSQYVSHGYMPAVCPDTVGFPSDLEREYDKHVYSANMKYGLRISDRTEMKIGVDGEFQQNNIDGCGFMIPEYGQAKTGAFVFGRQQLSRNSSIQLGVRFDYGHISTESYNDWFPSPIVSNGTSVLQYLQRADDIERSFSSFTWSVGYSLDSDHWIFKTNIGKSFRMPIAKELAANGVNYHNYSYEVGNADLSSEESYQFDLGTEFHTKSFAIGVSPFVNYFPNYIYLNPTSNHDRLYGNGNQIFYYTQSSVLRLGGELHAHYEPIRNLRLGVVSEYVYSEQLSGEKKGYALPFSPPASALINVRYNWEKAASLRNAFVSLDCKLAAKQTRIVPPEETTDGYNVFGLGAGCDIHIGSRKIILAMQMQNLFNVKYFNHTSFYRLINVPEAGRNFIVNISFPFSEQFN